MALYQTREFSFDQPDALIDKTHHIFSRSDDAPSSFTLAITRHPTAANESHNRQGDRLVGEPQRSFPSFELRKQAVAVVGNEPFLRLAHYQGKNDQRLHQILVRLFRRAMPDQEQAVQSTTTTDQSELSPNWQSAFSRLLASVRTRRLPEVLA